MKEFDFKRLTPEILEALATEYHEQGFVLLTGMEEVTQLFPMVLSDATELPGPEVEKMLDPQCHDLLSPVLRQRLSKVQTSPDLAKSLLKIMGPLLLRILGPVVHVSSSFHAQFKGGGVGQIGYSGFHAETEYIEIHGPHLLHQDFAAASLPISPSMITLWVALNTTDSWNLRLYPGSHRQGVLCSKFLEITNERLKELRDGVDIPAMKGQAILFNGMMLHGTGKQGSERRASCDIRFFPLCGFLPSEAHLLDSNPFTFLKRSLEKEKTSTLLAPLYQDLVFLGETDFVEKNIPVSDGEPFSPLHWIRYILHFMQGRREIGLPFLRSLVNTEIGTDDPETLARKFKDHPVYAETLRIVRQKIAGLETGSQDLCHLDKMIETVSRRFAG